MLFNFVILTFGIGLVIWRKPFSKYALEFQMKNFRIKVDDKDVRDTEIGCIIVGTILVIWAAAKYLGY